MISIKYLDYCDVIILKNFAYLNFSYFQWGAGAFNRMLIVPPGSGIVHQVNLEHLARVVFAGEDGLLYPDSVVGTDSHTTMINGLGVLGWGVGGKYIYIFFSIFQYFRLIKSFFHEGIEAEAVMLGQAISMLLPPVVGYKLIGELDQLATSTDLVLTITKVLIQNFLLYSFFLNSNWNKINFEASSSTWSCWEIC